MSSAAPSGLPSHLSIHQVVQEIRASRQLTARLDAELAALFEQRAQVERRIKSLPCPSREIDRFRAEMEGLAERVDTTSQTAFSLSSKVKALDTAQSRLQGALDRVELVLDLKTTARKVDRLISSDNLSDAARELSRVLHSSASSPPSAPPSDPSYGTLLQLEKRLKVALRERLAAVLATPGLPEPERVLECCQLFHEIGLGFEGVEEYSKFCVRALLAQLEKKGLTLRSQPRGAVIPFIELVTGVVNRIAIGLKAHGSMLSKHFGKGSQLVLIQRLYALYDELVTPLLKRFLSDRRVDRLASKVQQANVSSAAPPPSVLKARAAALAEANSNKKASESGAGAGASTIASIGRPGGRDSSSVAAAVAAALPRRDPDPNHLEDMLEEMAYVSRVTEDFDAGMRRHARRALEQLRANGDEEFLRRLAASTLGEELPSVSETNRVVHEIAGHYTVMEEYCMMLHVQLAITVDEELADSLTSSVVDEVFYVLQTTTERALSTCNAGAACAIVNRVNGVLSRDYLSELERTLRESHNAVSSGGASNFTSYFLGSRATAASSSSSSSASQSPAAQSLYTALNNLGTSADHVALLKQQVDSEAAQNFADENVRAKVAHFAMELQETGRAFRALLQSYIGKLGQRVGAAIKPLLAKFGTTEYNIDEAEYHRREADDPFVDEFLLGLEAELAPLREVFTEDNYDRLLHSLVNHIAKRLQNGVMRKRFTFWGGLQFDKDIRKMTTFFANKCQKAVWDKFSKLNQVATILQLERPEEILELYDAQNWKLYDQEIKQVMMLRTEKDFASHTVKQLALPHL